MKQIIINISQYLEQTQIILYKIVYRIIGFPQIVNCSMKSYSLAQLLGQENMAQNTDVLDWLGLKNLSDENNHIPQQKKSIGFGQSRLNNVIFQKANKPNSGSEQAKLVQTLKVPTNIQSTNQAKLKIFKYQQGKLEADKNNLNKNKSKNQLHKKLKILDNPANSTLPTTKFKSIKYSQQIKNQQQKSKSYIFFDIFSTINNRNFKQTQNQSIIDKTQIRNQKLDFFIAQNTDCTVYIGELTKDIEYKPIRKILLDATITTLKYLPQCQCQRKTNKIARKSVEDRLLIGCNNGNINLINNFVLHIFKKEDVILGYQFTIDTKLQLNFKQSMIVSQENSISVIINHLQKPNTIYIVLGKGKKIKRYDFQLLKSKLNSQQVEKQNVQQSQNSKKPTKKIYTYIQYDPSVQITIKSQIKILQYIKIKKQKQQKIQDEICMLIYLEGMHAPCILDQYQIELWFPERLDKLVQIFNKFWEDIYGYMENKSNSFLIYQQPQSVKIPQQKIEQIQNICHSAKLNQVIIGCNNGLVHFCKIIKTVSMIKRQNYIYNKKVDEKQDNPVTIFNNILQRHLIINQDSKLLHLALLENQPYLCIAYENKIMFYDLQNRMRFFENLKQKTVSKINFVGWTSKQKLIFCSRLMQEGKTYVYSKQMPIRENTQTRNQ